MESDEFINLKIPIKKAKSFSTVSIPEFAQIPYQLQTKLDEINESNIDSIVEFIISNYKKNELQIAIDEILFFSNLKQKRNNLYGELLIRIGRSLDKHIDPVIIGKENGFVVRYMYDQGYYTLKQIKNACENCMIIKNKQIYLPLYLFFAHEFGLYEKDAHYYGFSSKYFEKLKEDDYYLLDEILKNGYETNSLTYCIMKDDLVKFKQFIEAGIEKDDTIVLNTFEGLYRDYELYLADAAGYFGAKNILNYLFSLKVRPDDDIIRWSIIGRHTEIIDFLVEKEAEFDGAMKYALQTYDVEICDKILKLDKKPISLLDVSQTGFISGAIYVLGNTEIPGKIDGENVHNSLVNHHRLLSSILLEEDADITFKTKQGRTLLHDAVENGYYEVITKLSTMLCDFLVPDNQETFPLHLAAASGNIDVLKFIFNNSREVLNKTDAVFGIPLHYACRYNFYDGVVFLVNSGAEVNKEGRDGYTPLHIASKRNNEKIVLFLKEHGAEMTKKSEKGHKAKKISHSTLVRGMFN
ncbi:hypothetical protein TVAG_359030 [Trichomonas vaginalis G3]|uniref:Uncharacterized protein n=1 Tax=Trichomonas vaginalis (strain ATCC PRA-98 / G3) TaxID=412133 RepID=A2E8A5_TRIV3|nr:spectrin binding [Trichomonas vaginalis G3]EAY11123.1 hypothetical protein TVAG_359030 [Trichomonas vaginalis G3]KAI5492575.1 spectrin binding [Trichomonas vaginalis G3]|eukprot:XP_001323346.1 hypothetical protein [Trichomonas vaginalis G3]